MSSSCCAARLTGTVPDVGRVGRGLRRAGDADGIDAVYFVAQENYPVEFLELGFPARLHTYAIHRDSGGPGRHRGGCGMCASTRCWPTKRCWRCASTAWQSRHGVSVAACPAAPAAPWSTPAGTERLLEPLSDGNLLRTGDILRLETGGGGGYGHPFDRPAEAVLHDVQDGFVSVDAAARHYGVILREGALDFAATEAPAPPAPPPAPFTALVCRCARLTRAFPLPSISAAPSPTSRLQDPATGRAWRAKTPSIPSDPSQAFINGVTLRWSGGPRAAGSIARVLHGTTVATNMILEGKGAHAALVTTAGFRHVLEIGRQDIPRRANLWAWIKPQRPVPPSRILEVVERVGPGGEVLTPLDEASVAEAAEACRRLGVQAVAVCLLHSFSHPAHEQRVADLLRRHCRGWR